MCVNHTCKNNHEYPDVCKSHVRKQSRIFWCVKNHTWKINTNILVCVQTVDCVQITQMYWRVQMSFVQVSWPPDRHVFPCCKLMTYDLNMTVLNLGEINVCWVSWKCKILLKSIAIHIIQILLFYRFKIEKTIAFWKYISNIMYFWYSKLWLRYLEV